MFTYMPDDRGISFDVNETFYFNSGHGISEMLSISLDPDILVQSHSDYAQVRGLLILNGEFKKSPNRQRNLELHQQTNQIEKVDDVDELLAKFYHRIPVEVAIPLYRINDINDIKAVVESFDYEMPNEYSLRINASLHVLGLNSVDDEMNKDAPGFVIHNNRRSQSQKNDIQVHEMNTNNDSISDESNNPNEQLDENFTVSKQSNEDIKDSSVNDDVLQEEEKSEIDVQLMEKEQSDEQLAEEEQTDVLFLTEFLSKEDEENQTKLTIHITQEDDTIDSIASRYDIPTTKLMQDNNLTNHPLEVGSLLTITEKKE